MNTREIAVIFNTNQLGGAEKSLIEQLKVQSKTHNFKLFIPNLDVNRSPLADELRKYNIGEIHTFKYPAFLYSISRAKGANLIKFILMSPLLVYFVFHWNTVFGKFHEFYANGNKASVPILIWANLFFKKCKLYWHFRDYPEPGYFRLIQKYVSLSQKIHKQFKIKIIANSFSVAHEVKKFFPQAAIEVVYNLVGEMPKKDSEGIKRIGVVAMHAPWKGLHSVILMSKLYERELKEIGIEKIVFFGSNIYKTDQLGADYSKSLLSLTSKLSCDLIEWGGHLAPEKIYRDIDLLIHPSLKPEPFGRIILEAFLSGVPVVSTGLGGSSELVGESEHGVKYILHDYKGLFDSIHDLTTNKDKRLRLEKSAYHQATEIENQALETLDRIFL